MATPLVETTPAEPSRRDAARRYPPLASMAIALLIALAVLPSALTLPQTNPSQTVEIAPVPPDDEVPPQQGNLSQLGLAESGGPQGDGTGGEGEGPGGGGPDTTLGLDPGLPPPPELPEGLGTGKSKTAKRCVQVANKQGQKELRQTEDIISPPCTAEFTGDNGGATYQGVTGEEIKILIYAEGGIISQPTPRGSDASPANQLYDLDRPAEPNENGDILTLRTWFKYFNERYQTYGRRAHGFIYYSSGSPFSQQQRLADAAQAYSQVKPFAVISTASFGSTDSFLRYMAQRGVLNFGSVQGRQQAFFQQFPKLIWGYPPSTEQQARLYVDFICTRLRGGTAVGAGSNRGGPPIQGQPRKYGLIASTDPLYPNLFPFRQAVLEGLKACGVEMADTAEYPRNGFAIDGDPDVAYAQQGMARFAQKGITTLIWPGGSEPNFSVAANNLGYQPEIFLAGDGQNDAASYATRQNQQTWARAWAVTPAVKEIKAEERVCYQAYRTIDTQAQDADVINSACPVYNDLRQLFTGIQVAGPRLGPTSVDKGFHAIPAVESPDPRVAACFYEVGDYTCVKDAQAMWYDPSGDTDNDELPGCYRMLEGGIRHIFGKWPKGDPHAQKGDPASNPCNQYSTNYNLNTPPTP